MRLAFTIPDGIAWGDYFVEQTAPLKIEECDDAEDGWETSGAKKTIVMVLPSARPTERPAKWCKHSNACLWQNCPFRHERCAHYDNWIARGKKGYTCRSCVADPDSCKSPEEGGCKYDHRDLRKLAMYQKDLPCETIEQMCDNFCKLGLEVYASDAFGISNMSRTDKALLFRSLKTYDIEFEDNETWIDVCFR
jgi:hypothetical protein